MRLQIVLYFLLILVIPVSGQETYRFKSFRVEQGLPTDMVKDVQLDQRGFLWICTDDGIVLYNAKEFRTYKQAVLSQYTKKLLLTSSNELFMIGDLDLLKITNNIDSIQFERVFRGTHDPTDTSVWFPKGIFEDSKSRIWVSEPQSIAMIQGKTLKRYIFSDKTRSPSFLRSYALFEGLDQRIYACSYVGDLYILHEDTGEFKELPPTILTKIGHVQGVQRIGNRVFFATREGLFQGILQESGVSDLVKILDASNLSAINSQSDSILWVGSGRGALYKINVRKSPAQTVKLDFNFTNVNNISFGNNNDLWVSTDRGMVQVQPNLFRVVNPDKSYLFVESVVEGEPGEYYYAIKEELYKMVPTPAGLVEKSVYAENLGYFQSLVYDQKNKRLWASNTSRVMLFENDKLIKTYSYISQGQFIHELYIDTYNNVWIIQDNNNKVIQIAPDLTQKVFTVKGHTSGTNLGAVREGSNGYYLSGTGVNSYLFFCPLGGTEFTNISVEVPFPVVTGFLVNDFCVSDKTIWMGTTEGLVMLEKNQLSLVDLGPSYAGLGVRSIELLGEKLIFSNSYGIFNYDYKNNTYILYDESSGLPSRNMNTRGIYIDRKSGIWIGTSGGLAYAQQLDSRFTNVPLPVCVEARLNGYSIKYMNGINMDFGELLDLSFTSLIYNDLPVQMQYRTNGDTWINLLNTNVVLSGLKAGNYDLEVRQRTGSSMVWSEPFGLSIKVKPPLWQRPVFIIMVLVIIFSISYASYAIGVYFVNKRREILEELVSKRTLELRQANEELSQRNSELDRFVYSASHDLSAPLKSILGLIAIAKLESPGKLLGDYLAKMEISVRKLESFINDVVSYSRNSRLPAKLESIHFEPFVRNLLEDHQFAERFAEIDFIVEDKFKKEIRVDTIRLKIIINNLVSNAIKFHRFVNNKPFVRIAFELIGPHYVLTVEDNGSGIAHHHIARIFEMFYRANDAIQGSGLGLYILKEAVLKMKGEVKIDSRSGAGTTFTIYIPVNQEGAAE